MPERRHPDWILRGRMALPPAARQQQVLDLAHPEAYAHIAERCPELASSLASSPYAAWLPPDWNKPNNELSVGGLVELRRLLTRSEPAPTVRPPRVARLSGVLTELHRKAVVFSKMMGRFTDANLYSSSPNPYLLMHVALTRSALVSDSRARG